MKRDDSSPDAYRASVDGKQRKVLEAVRNVVRAAAPAIEEGIRYGMLDYPGLANLAAQKQYVSLYVAPAVLARHAADFKGIDHGKSCLRFKRIDQVDEAALRSLLDDVLAERAGSD